MIFSVRVHIILAICTLYTLPVQAMAPLSAASPSIQQQRRGTAWDDLMHAMLSDSSQEMVTNFLNTWHSHEMHDTSLSKTNEDGECLIHIAARKGYHEVLSTLCTLHKNISSIDVPTHNHEKATALHCAAHAGNLSAVVKLIEHGADTNAQTSAKITPILMALFGYSRKCSNQAQDLELEKQYRQIIKSILDKHPETIDLQEFTVPPFLQKLFSQHEENIQGKKDAHQIG